MKKVDILLRKKLNLLVYLAKSDGHFSSGERELVLEFLREQGASNLEIPENASIPDLSSFVAYGSPELLFWALKIMMADGLVHENEEAFCKTLALKLGYDPGVVNIFRDELPAFEEFTKLVKRLA